VNDASTTHLKGGHGRPFFCHAPLYAISPLASWHIQLESTPMFAARPFVLNTATAALAGVAVRAITIKTTTIIKG